MAGNRLKITAVLTAIFAVLSLGAIFYRAGTKNIIIVEATENSAGENTKAVRKELDIVRGSGDKAADALIIPLEAGVGSDGITFEENHIKHEFSLFIKGKDEEFYTKNAISSDLDCIKGLTLSTGGDINGACLTFDLDGLYEADTALGDGEIVVHFNKPGDLYENVALVDSLDEVGMRMVPFLKKAVRDDENIQLYFAENASDEEISSLMEETGADFYVQIGLRNETENQGGIKTYYNERFFIRNFGNIQLSDELEKACAIAAGNKALGLEVMPKGNVKLSKSVVPSAQVTVGNISNRVDLELMEDDAYLEKCAEGIAEGLRSAFGITNPAEEEKSSDALQGIINGK